MGGVIFAYMGSGEPPPFPRYDFLIRQDGERTYDGYLRECNFMNQLDNCLDPVHATILHGREVNGARENPERARSRNSKFWPTIYSPAMSPGAKDRLPEKNGIVKFLTRRPCLVIHDGGSRPATRRLFGRCGVAHAH